MKVEMGCWDGREGERSTGGERQGGDESPHSIGRKKRGKLRNEPNEVIAKLPMKVWK
jgi:hypothetical protein